MASDLPRPHSLEPTLVALLPLLSLPLPSSFRLALPLTPLPLSPPSSPSPPSSLQRSTLRARTHQRSCARLSPASPPASPPPSSLLSAPCSSSAASSHPSSHSTLPAPTFLPATYWRVELPAPHSRTTIALLLDKQEDGSVTLRPCEPQESSGLRILESVLTIPWGQIKLRDRIYVLSPTCYHSSKGWPEGTFSLAPGSPSLTICPLLPKDDASDFIIATRKIREKILEGMKEPTPLRGVRKVEVDITEPLFKEIFAPFTSSQRRVLHQTGHLIFDPDWESPRVSFAEADVLTEISKIHGADAMKLIAAAKKNQTPILLKAGKLESLKQLKRSLDSQDLGESFKRVRLETVSKCQERRVAISLSWEEIQALEKKIGHFTTKTYRSHVEPSFFISPRAHRDPGHLPLFPKFDVSYSPVKGCLILHFSYIFRFA